MRVDRARDVAGQVVRAAAGRIRKFEPAVHDQAGRGGKVRLASAATLISGETRGRVKVGFVIRASSPLVTAAHKSSLQFPMAIDLYWSSGSPFSWRVLLALELKGLSYNSHLLHLDLQEHKAPQMLAMNPRGRLPVLRDGDYVVFESVAVLYYLDRKYPEPPIFGRSAEEGGVILRVIDEFQTYTEAELMRILVFIARWFGRRIRRTYRACHAYRGRRGANHRGTTVQGRLDSRRCSVGCRPCHLSLHPRPAPGVAAPGGAGTGGAFPSGRDPVSCAGALDAAHGSAPGFPENMATGMAAAVAGELYRHESQDLFRVSRPPHHGRLRQHRPGRAAADPAAYQHPPRAHRHRHGRRIRPGRGQGAGRALHPGAAGAREFPARARRADGARRFPREPVGRCLQRGADQALLGTRRDVHRHLHRALGRWLHRPGHAAGPAHQLRDARRGAGAAHVR